MAIATRKYMPRRTKSTLGGIGGPAYVRRRSSSPAITKLKNELSKAKNSARVARAKNKSNFFSGSGIKPMAVATIAGGGAIAGAARIHFPQIAGFSTPLLVGGGLVAFSMFSKDDNMAAVTGALGAGMLASWSADASSIALLQLKADREDAE